MGECNCSSNCGCCIHVQLNNVYVKVAGTMYIHACTCICTVHVHVHIHIHVHVGVHVYVHIGWLNQAEFGMARFLVSKARKCCD